MSILRELLSIILVAWGAFGLINISFDPNASFLFFCGEILPAGILIALSWLVYPKSGILKEFWFGFIGAYLQTVETDANCIGAITINRDQKSIMKMGFKAVIAYCLVVIASISASVNYEQTFGMTIILHNNLTVIIKYVIWIWTIYISLVFLKVLFQYIRLVLRSIL